MKGLMNFISTHPVISAIVGFCIFCVILIIRSMKRGYEQQIDDFSKGGIRGYANRKKQREYQDNKDSVILMLVFYGLIMAGIIALYLKFAG